MAFSEEAALKAAGERVHSRFSHLPPDVVNAALHEACARFADRPIRGFIPILVERAATDALRSATAVPERTPAAV